MEEKIRELIAICSSKGWTIGSCESLTAGLFCDTIASVSGASAVLKGGLVTYFTKMKEVLAHVDPVLIETYGVISGECAKAMAENTRKIMDLSYAVSFTGNAGPSAMEGKPAGLVYCAIASKNITEVYELKLFDLKRNEVRERAVEIMLDHLIEKVKDDVNG